MAVRDLSTEDEDDAIIKLASFVLANDPLPLVDWDSFFERLDPGFRMKLGSVNALPEKERDFVWRGLLAKMGQSPNGGINQHFVLDWIEENFSSLSCSPPVGVLEEV